MRNETLRAIADALDQADRQGAATDEPEGARYITLSDTLAKKLAKQLRDASADVLQPRGHHETCPALRHDLAADQRTCTCGAAR